MLKLKKDYVDNDPVIFEGYPHKCFYRVLDKGIPQKGEYYLSGAIPEAYRAYKDMETEYWIIQPTHAAKSVHSYIRIPLK